MADLIGTASIRVDMPTAGAALSVRQFATRVDSQLRGVQRRVAATARELSRLRGTTVAIAVNDQTAAGVASVRAAVTDLRRLGPVRIPVQINDGTRRGALTVQTTVARLQRLGPIRVAADVDVDPAAAANAASALRGLQAAASSTSRSLGTLATRATTATAALVALGAAARTLRGDMDDLDGTIRRTGDGMTGLRGRLGTLSTSASGTGSAMDGLRKAAIALGPALIPIAAQAVPIAVSLTAATVAIGVFAAAAGGQVSAMSEAADAEKKYKDAVAEHGARSEEAAKAQAAYMRQLQKMPPATRQASAALSVFKDEYRQWSDALAGDTMPVATKAFATFGALFPKLTPVVRGTSVQLDRFFTIAAGAIQSPGFNAFMQRFADFSAGVLQRANDGLIRFTRTLNTGKVSGGASEFMEYVRANGPLVRETLSNLAQALTNILQAAANVGPGLLTVVNALAGLVAALPPGVITTMLQLALALKAVALAAATMTAVSAAATAFGLATGRMTTAAAGATGVLPRLAAAFGTLSRAAKVAVAGTGIGLLVIAISELSQIGRKAPPDVDKMTTSLGRLAQTGKLSGEAARVFGQDFNELGDALRTLARPSNLDKFQQSLTSLIGMDSTPVKDAKDAFNGLDEGLANLVKGGKADIAAEALKVSIANLKKQGFTAGEVRAQLDEYKASLADQALEQQLAAQAMGLFGQQAQQTSAKLAEQKQSADGLRQAIQALNDVNRAGLGGMIGFEAAIDAASKAARDNAGVLSMQGGQLSLNTDKQRAAAQALQDLASKTDEAAGAARESGQSWSTVNGIYERGRQQLVASAVQMGLTRAEAERLAATILKTPNKTALLKADITDWKSKIGEAEKQLKTAKGDKKAKLTADIADWKAKVAQAELQLKGAKADKRAKLTADVADWRAKIAGAEQQLLKAKGSKKATLTANIKDWQQKIAAALRQINSLPPSRSTKLTTTRHYINITENRVINTGKGGRGPNAATGGLYTGRDFKYRGRRGYATGGLVDGPGTETSDSVFAPWLSKNEFVVNAKQTAQHLPLLKAINSGQLGMGGGMAGAGTAVGAGLASGMETAARSVKDAARVMAAAVVSGIREELQISSPSKKTRALAKDVGAGFISGLTGSRAKIQSVAKDLSNDIKTAFSGRKESNLLRMVNRETKELLELAGKRDAISKKIADANKFAIDTASQARAGGSLASIVQQDAYSPKYVKGQMQASLNQIKAFTANVQKLQKKGLNKDLLKQILEMGPEQGAAFAASLANADSATIKQYNSLNSQINKESGKLGKVGADMLYDSGKKAGQGFLTGLKAQQKDIEKLMLSIAQAMQKSIKKALGIKSPSRVMEAVGRMTGLGLPVGITRTLPAVRSAMRRVAHAVASGAPAAIPAGISGIAARTAAVGTMRTAGAPRTPGTAPNVTVVVQNNGVLGSQRQVEDWLARSLDNLARTNRLPRGLRSAP
ncbi:hypothetical protein [Streptomyces dubilierae]|uniref:Tape measure protein n=1 Tax=Streptomyces dubilierae TaxID=3075533 RepID=A0ABU2P9V1_9ACTN|nr:hypothetical protein [Streptomyces sp. DSM 41921]MDT0387809.1 hypothetical protein [Streptomyces sp. DSM 41921]